MKTISITLDDNTLQAVNTLTKTSGMPLSEFVEYALQLALQQQRIRELEEKHKQGYLKKPVEKGEFSDWENEQVWGD